MEACTSCHESLAMLKLCEVRTLSQTPIELQASWLDWATIAARDRCIHVLYTQIWFACSPGLADSVGILPSLAHTIVVFLRRHVQQ
jgi:hypothetical protein